MKGAKARWAPVILIVILSLLSAGCFQIRVFKVKEKSLAGGETTRVRVELYPVSMSTLDTADARVFLLIGVDNIEIQSVSRFDLDGNWGGSFGREQNLALEALLLSGGVCSRNGVDASAMQASFDEWRVYVTGRSIDADSPTAAQLETMMLSNVVLKAPAGVGADDRGDVVIFTGAWQDGVVPPENDVPEAGEAVCTGFVTFSVPYTG